MMYMIAYYIRPTRTRTPNDVRSDLEDEIVQFGDWWHYFGDFWLVDTDRDINEMTKILRRHLGPRDDLLIAGVQPPYQGLLMEEAWDWVNDKARKYGKGRTRDEARRHRVAAGASE